MTYIDRIWKHIPVKRRGQLGLLLLLNLAASFAEGLSIGAVLPFLAILTAPNSVFVQPVAQPFIDIFKLNTPDQLLMPLTVGFSVIVLLSGCLRWSVLWMQTRVGHAIGADLSAEIYRRTLYQKYSVHLSRNSSEVISGITTKISVLVNNTVMPILSLVSAAVMLIAILATLIIIDPSTAISAISGFGGIYLIVIRMTKRALEQDGMCIGRESTRVIKALQEGLGGIRDVLLDGAQATFFKIYRDADVPFRQAQANIQLIGGSPRFVIEVFATILFAWFAYILAGKPGGVSGALPVLGALAIGAQRILPALQQIYLGIAAMRGGRASLDDALCLLEQRMTYDANGSFSGPIAFISKITLEQIGFKYTRDARPVLKKVDLVIPKGSRIGFVGTTGSGKSTLLDILMGLLEPSAGRLLVDGVEITAENCRSWQAHIAHVPQTIFITDDTLAANIAFGVPSELIDHDRVREAAVRAQIADTIEVLPKGYQELAGEKGMKLSGGQRQRIGIARALYKRADVIVFDEATSALDNDTERSVMEAIEALGSDLTIFMVAHRLTTLRNCTKIIELLDGKIRRVGAYEDIVRTRVNRCTHIRHIH